MTKFEDQLRAGLRDAAEGAPEFHGLDRTSAVPAGDRGARARRFRRPSRLIVAAAAAVVVVGAGAGVFAALNHQKDDTTQSASCAGELELAGRQYIAIGDLMRTPKPGKRLGTATIPPCTDGNDSGRLLTAYRLADVGPKTAVLADGQVWVTASANSLPAKLSALRRPVTCSSGTPFTASGHLTEIDAQPSGDDFDVSAPYTATLSADRGSGLPLTKFSSVTVSVRVGNATIGGEDPAVLRPALTDGSRVNVSLSCDNGDFVATALRLAPTS